MRIFITGAAGYVGGMLADLFLNDPAVEKVIALDFKDASARFPQDNSRFMWITHNLGDDGWQNEVLKEGPIDIIIHCAYVIRQGYGKKRQWQVKSNIVGAEKLFDFAFKNNAKKIIHYSTVASYGAFKTNKLDQWFKETDPFREDGYLYATDKRVIEEKLESEFKKAKNEGKSTKVYVLRPCAISGPRGQFMFKRFGLLQMVKEGLPIVPVAGSQSARQFVHEDDVADITKFLIKEEINSDYEVFNIAPRCYFLLRDMARQIGKKTIRIPKWLGKLGFAFLWHITRGKVPTVPISINSYSYPIIVDGSKITQFGYKYKYDCGDALNAQKGYYSKFIGKD